MACAFTLAQADLRFTLCVIRCRHRRLSTNPSLPLRSNEGECGIGSIKANIDSKNYTNTDTCYLELFNINNASIITKSTICTNSATPEWVESENILDYFPNKDIDLTVRIRSSKNGSVAGAYSASLYINF